MQRSNLPEPSALSFEPEASSTGADLHPYDLSLAQREIMFGDVLPLERSSFGDSQTMKFYDTRPELYRGSTDIPTVNAWLQRHRRGASTGARRLMHSGKVHFFAEGFEAGRDGHVMFLGGVNATFTCCVFGKITPRIREWLEKQRARVRKLAPHEVVAHTSRFSDWMKIDPLVLR